MSTEKLDETAVLAAALAAHAKAKPDERLVRESFGTFHAGGCYWTLDFHREAGNVKTAGEPVRPEDREHENRRIIATWQKQYFSPRTTDGEQS